MLGIHSAVLKRVLAPSVRPSALRASHVLLCPSSVAVGRRRCYSSTWPTRWTTMTTVGLGGERPSEQAPGGRRATATGHHESSDRDRPTDRPANGGEGGKKAKSRPSVSSYGVLRKNLSRPLSMSQPGPHAHAVFQPPARPPLPVFTCE